MDRLAIIALALAKRGGGGGGAVNSVNGQTGTVVLDADDVGAAAEPNEVTVLDAGDVSQECVDNTIYKFMGSLTSLTLTQVTSAREYMVIFVTGSTAPTVIFPSGVKFPDTLTIEANTRYEISIREGYAVAQSWEVSA